MLRDLIRNWLFPSASVPQPEMDSRPYDTFRNTTRENYELDETMYFAIRKVGNGHVITMRIYSEKRSTAANNNQFGNGPPFTDVIRVVSENDNLLEVLGNIVLQHKVLNK